jgi:hypothetical protein
LPATVKVRSIKSVVMRRLLIGSEGQW